MENRVMELKFPGEQMEQGQVEKTRIEASLDRMAVPDIGVTAVVASDR